MKNVWFLGLVCLLLVSCGSGGKEKSGSEDRVCACAGGNTCAGGSTCAGGDACKGQGTCAGQMYANAAGIVPVIEVFVAKGIPMGTAIAFMMAVVGLSLPEARWLMVSCNRLTPRWRCIPAERNRPHRSIPRPWK